MRGEIGSGAPRAPLIAALGAVIVVVAVTAWGLASSGAAVHHRPSAARRSASSAPPTVSDQGLPSLAAFHVPGKLKLKFNPHFTGGRLDKQVWDTCYPWMDRPTGCTNFGHQEYEWYVPAQDHVSHGLLYLTARRSQTLGLSARGRRQIYQCRSGMVTTFRSFHFEYGVVRIVARMPNVVGMWPGLWLAATNEHFPPEIDIVEHWVRPQYSTGVFLHALGGPREYAFPNTANLAVGWHSYTLVWTRHVLAWFIDGRLVLSVHHYIPHQSMYLIADLADARSPARGGCGSSLIIRSVAIWQTR